MFRCEHKRMTYSSGIKRYPLCMKADPLGYLVHLRLQRVSPCTIGKMLSNSTKDLDSDKHCIFAFWHPPGDVFKTGNDVYIVDKNAPAQGINLSGGDFVGACGSASPSERFFLWACGLFAIQPCQDVLEAGLKPILGLRPASSMPCVNRHPWSQRICNRHLSKGGCTSPA